MKKAELLEDYCQRCGNVLGSFECCQSQTNKWLRSEENQQEDPNDDPSDDQHLEQ